MVFSTCEGAGTCSPSLANRSYRMPRIAGHAANQAIAGWTLSYRCVTLKSAMRNISQDLRFGLRLFLSSPGFTVVAVLTLALAIATNTTVFSWIDTVLLHPYPGSSDSRQLAVLEMIIAGAPNGANQTSYLDYRDYRRNLKSLSGLAVPREDVFSLG